MSMTRWEFVMRKYDSDRNGSLDVYEFGSLVEDLRVNTTQSVKERLSLRTHKKVEAALKLWSKAVWRSMEGDPRRLTDEQGEASTSSTSALGLGRAQYIDLMRRIIHRRFAPNSERKRRRAWPRRTGHMTAPERRRDRRRRDALCGLAEGLSLRVLAPDAPTAATQRHAPALRPCLP
jgi:hypothetical protein